MVLEGRLANQRLAEQLADLSCGSIYGCEKVLALKFNRARSLNSKSVGKENILARGARTVPTKGV